MEFTRQERSRAEWHEMTDRTRGFLIGGAAVFLITPDALLCRLAGANESVAVVTFWRSAFICALCCVITSVGHRDVRRLLRLTRDHIRPLLFIGAISSVTSLGFPLSFMMTGSAEALLIISLNPLWAGLIGWWFLDDVLPLRTRLALAGATASIALIFVPRVLGVDGRTSREQQPYRLAGDALAFLTGLSLASAMNAMRYYRRKHNQLPAQVVQIIASGTVTLVTAPLCSPSIIPREPGSLLPTAVAMAACISTADPWLQHRAQVHHRRRIWDPDAGRDRPRPPLGLSCAWRRTVTVDSNGRRTAARNVTRARAQATLSVKLGGRDAQQDARQDSDHGL